MCTSILDIFAKISILKVHTGTLFFRKTHEKNTKIHAITFIISALDKHCVIFDINGTFYIFLRGLCRREAYSGKLAGQRVEFRDGL